MHTIQASAGQQGKHRYFTASMRVGELEQLVRFPDDLPELDDDHRMQRGLAKKRIGELVEYLLEADDHFFSAVTLFVMPRDFSRPATEGTSGDVDEEFDYAFERIEVPNLRQNRLGLLHLSGDAFLFTGDGQHRLTGEFEAMKRDSDLAREELPVVLIPFESVEQVRQLFSDLNLNAKPVSKTVGYDFSRRDPYALLAKDVMREFGLFRDRTNRRSNSLSKTSKNVITMNVLVEGTRNLIEGLAKAHGITTDEYAADRDFARPEVLNAWEDVIDPFIEYWQPILDGEDDHDRNIAGELREHYVFPHGLGWQGLTQAVGALIAEDPQNWSSRYRRAVAAFDWRKEAPVWRGNAVLENETGTLRVNNTGPGIKALAEKVLAQA